MRPNVKILKMEKSYFEKAFTSLQDFSGESWMVFFLFVAEILWRSWINSPVGPDHEFGSCQQNSAQFKVWFFLSKRRLSVKVQSWVTKKGLCSDYSRTIVSYYHYCAIHNFICQAISNITTQWINSNIKKNYTVYNFELAEKFENSYGSVCNIL